MSTKENLELDWEEKVIIIANLLKSLKKLPLQLVESVNLNETEENENIWKNKLIYGNNSLIMNSMIREYEGKVDLIYLYVPNFRIEEKFWDKSNSLIEVSLLEKENSQTEIEYLSSLYVQFFLMKRLLSGKSSIYVHLNKTNIYTHYIKVLLDELFGIENFKRGVYWDTPDDTNLANKFECTSDNILFYTKTERSIFNVQHRPLTQSEKEKKESEYDRVDEDGRRFKLTRRNNKKYLEVIKGDPRTDILRDISIDSDISGNSYRDVKPVELIKLFIAASSNEGDLVAVFNSFTGSGIIAAESLNRRWIGCVNNKYAIHLIKNRLINFPNIRSFEIYNLGKYERQLWKIPLHFPMDKIKRNYMDFMLKLYNANEKRNAKYINGIKGSFLIHIADVDETLSLKKLELIKKELFKLKQKKLKVLCWEREKGVQNAKEKDYECGILTVPQGILKISKNIKNDIQFFENAYISAILEKDGAKYKIVFSDFGIPIISDLIISQYSKITHWSDLIDFWTIDYNFTQIGYNIDKLSYCRTEKTNNLRLDSDLFQLPTSKNEMVVLKITDVLGNTSFKIFNKEDK